MLKCPLIGDHFYLMADLQEICFQDLHLNYVLLLTIPQIILYILGLPLAATLLVMRNKKNLHQARFYTRYGLLYLGYRDERAWWELIVALRKVAVVSIGTFGTLLGVVDLQAHLALMTIFVSIIVHLIGKPFDVSKPNARLLHNLELAALCICWMTFWGGLLFFLGHEKEGSVSDDVKILTTVCLVLSNVLFLIGSFLIFAREYINDRKKMLQRKSNIGMQQQELTQIVPIAPVSTDDDDEGRRKSVTKSHASFVHDFWN